MKVYIVTDGEYSDTTIAAVFSTKEKAQQFIQDATEKGDPDYYHHREWVEFEVDRAKLEWFEGPGTSTERYREIIKLY